MVNPDDMMVLAQKVPVIIARGQEDKSGKKYPKPLCLPCF